MASPATVYFAGIATVVAAIGVGFGGALIVTDTKPIHKEGPAAFAKRDQPVMVETPAVAPVVAAQAQPATPTPTEDVAPLTATTAEKVVALDYAPPQPAGAVPANPVPQPVVVPSKPTVAPDATQNIQATAGAKKVREPDKVEKKKAPNPVVKSEPRKQYAEKPVPRRSYGEKRRRAPLEVEEDDDSPRMSFAIDRGHERRGGDFFSSLFGN